MERSLVSKGKIDGSMLRRTLDAFDAGRRLPPRPRTSFSSSSSSSSSSSPIISTSECGSSSSSISSSSSEVGALALALVVRALGFGRGFLTGSGSDAAASSSSVGGSDRSDSSSSSSEAPAFVLARLRMEAGRFQREWSEEGEKARTWSSRACAWCRQASPPSLSLPEREPASKASVSHREVGSPTLPPSDAPWSRAAP